MRTINEISYLYEETKEEELRRIKKLTQNQSYLHKNRR